MLFKAFVVSIMWSIDKTVDFFPRVSDVSYVVGLAAKKRTPKKTNLKFDYNVTILLIFISFKHVKPYAICFLVLPMCFKVTYAFHLPICNNKVCICVA